jgi:hypothetical protein
MPRPNFLFGTLAPVKVPSEWTPAQREVAARLFRLRADYPDDTRLLTLKIVGQILGKTPGQMNRAHTESGFAQPKAEPKPKAKNRTRRR